MDVLGDGKKSGRKGYTDTRPVMGRGRVSERGKAPAVDDNREPAVGAFHQGHVRFPAPGKLGMRGPERREIPCFECLLK